MRIDGELPVFVEREFACAGKPMIVRFYQPTKNPTGEYKCRYEIAWPDKTKGRHAHGIDMVQALLLAMRVVHTELKESDYFKRGELTYLDEMDFDLPPPFRFDE